MYIALRNGRFIAFPEANQYDFDADFLRVMGPRKRLIARFSMSAVAGFWYDCEDCITYGTSDQVERS